MSSAADSNSSLQSERERKRSKVHKKLKMKSEKKHKVKRKSSHKEKKRTRKELTTTCTEEDDTQTLKSQFSKTKYEESASSHEDASAFGPALPPHLLNKNNERQKNVPSVIGPIIPKEFLGKLEKTESNLSEEFFQENVSTEELQNIEDNLQGFYGPLPITKEVEMTPTQRALEQRALELKMASIDGMHAQTNNQNVREEWMLELPEVGLKGGLAALHNLKRGFHQGKEKPDFSDRSSWTKTPNSGKEKKKTKISKEEIELQAQALFEKRRDAEQEALAKDHKKKHKREQSLVEIHQKKLRKEEKRKAKELKESGCKVERRPFTRDVDLKLNKIDRNQTKQIVDKAKILNAKFSSGHSKYL